MTWGHQAPMGSRSKNLTRATTNKKSSHLALGQNITFWGSMRNFKSAHSVKRQGTLLSPVATWYCISLSYLVYLGSGPHLSLVRHCHSLLNPLSNPFLPVGVRTPLLGSLMLSESIDCHILSRLVLVPVTCLVTLVENLKLRFPVIVTGQLAQPIQ